MCVAVVAVAGLTAMNRRDPDGFQRRLAIHGLAFRLVVGAVVGTYSSIYVASPVLVWMGRQGAVQSTSIRVWSRAAISARSGR